MGHEERFPPRRLSAGYRFRKETIAEVRHNARDAPFGDIPIECRWDVARRHKIALLRSQ